MIYWQPLTAPCKTSGWCIAPDDYGFSFHEKVQVSCMSSTFFDPLLRMFYPVYFTVRPRLSDHGTGKMTLKNETGKPGRRMNLWWLSLWGNPTARSTRLFQRKWRAERAINMVTLSTVKKRQVVRNWENEQTEREVASIKRGQCDCYHSRLHELKMLSITPSK